MSLLFNMLSTLVIAFLPRRKHFLISWLQSPSAVILKTLQNKVSHYFHCFPIYLPWSDGNGCHDLFSACWVLSQLFHSPVSLSSRGSLVLLRFLPTLPTMVRLVKAMVFPGVIYGCESWTMEKANALANWCEELTHWIRPWCWERMKVGGEGEDRGWDGWMALPTWWAGVWASSGNWWWTGKPGVLQSMESQRVRHNWATELNWLSKLCSDAGWTDWPVEGNLRIQRKTICQLPFKIIAGKNLPECRRPGFNPWVGNTPWRRAWQPTPVFSPGESHGQRSLMGYSPWGSKELDVTKQQQGKADITG